MLAAVTGIDGCGKGYVTARIAEALRQRGLRVAAYRTIYFPAQEIHFARDQPRAAATAIVNNDPRLPNAA